MNMWCHLPTGFKRRHVLPFVALASIIVALITTLIFAHAAHAVPSTNKTISFQGRLQTAAGAIVPDGHYNIQFKIYQDGDGTDEHNPGGTLKWTESYVNDNTNAGVLVKNGYFSVSLGSVIPFGSSVDWNQDTLFLSMNVAGKDNACTDFDSCSPDGEMLPMKRITATPYALNAGALGGKTADNFIQLAQGVQTDASTNTSSIHINKTGTGNLIQLQNTGKDAFNVTNTGNIEFGSSDNHAIYIQNSPPDTAGKNLTIFAGYGGSGTGSMGGGLFIQGGGAGGDNGDGGDVAITGGAKTGTGKNGSVFIGATDTDTIQIGDPSLVSGTQTINVGNNTSGGTTNVTIGAGAGASNGTTKIQSKDNTTIATNGVDRATFDTSGNLTLGNGTSSATPADFNIQGTASSANGVSGGNLTIQGGGATTGDANGGNLHLSGGNGSGSGSKGVVVIDTPAYATSSVQSSAADTAVTQANIDSFGVITLNATTPNINFTLGAPSLGANAVGRIVYVMGATGSQEFTLRANVGAGTGIEQNLKVSQNTAVTMIWNGTLWTTAGGGSPTTLQAAYDNTPQTAGNAEIVVNGNGDTNGLTVRDNSDNPTDGPLLEVQNSSAATLFSVNSNIDELATNPGAETAGGSASTFPANTWGIAGTATVTRQSTPGDYIASGKGSVKVVTGSVAASGAYDRLRTTLAPDTTYNVSLSIRVESGSFSDFGVTFAPDGATPESDCALDTTIEEGAWRKVNCTFQTPASGITSSNVIGIGQTGTTARTFYIDNLSVTPAGDKVAPAGDASSNKNATSNVQVGGGAKSSSPTLFTLDKSASAPTSTNHDALLGSMYYDTTLGKVQCYESEGWGQCGDRPDTFVTLSPEYPGAVTSNMSGSIGQPSLTSGFCSDALNLNDGSTSGSPAVTQPSICGTNEAYNFYKASGTNFSAATGSIFVTYKLPSNFKEFVPDSTSLTGRTDNASSSIAFQVYRKNQNADLTACGSSISVSTGVKTIMQVATATGSSDPANCSFAAGDSIVVKIDLSVSYNTNAYLSNLGFTYKIN